MKEPDYVRKRERRGCIVSVFVGLATIVWIVWMWYRLGSLGRSS
jgi:hypothetical protein